MTTISIVDDDPIVREAIADLVESLGYEAATFESAEQFLASGAIGETSCLITDLQMSGQSGLELQRHRGPCSPPGENKKPRRGARRVAMRPLRDVCSPGKAKKYKRGQPKTPEPQ